MDLYEEDYYVWTVRNAVTRARTELARAVELADKVDYLGDAARLHAARLRETKDQ